MIEKVKMKVDRKQRKSSLTSKGFFFFIVTGNLHRRATRFNKKRSRLSVTASKRGDSRDDVDCSSSGSKEQRQQWRRKVQRQRQGRENVQREKIKTSGKSGRAAFLAAANRDSAPPFIYQALLHERVNNHLSEHRWANWACHLSEGIKIWYEAFSMMAYFVLHVENLTSMLSKAERQRLYK